MQRIFTLNAVTLLEARQDPAYATMLLRAELLVADGIGAVWAFKRLSGRSLERVTGIDLLDELVKVCWQEGQRVFLLGGQPGVAEQAAAALIRRYPGLAIAGSRHGFWSAQDEQELIAEINRSQTDLLLVGLGQPRQEKFLDHYHAQLQVRVAMGVGGSFDVIAGGLKRAPGWMQKYGLEWLFRLLQEPLRIRTILRLPGFIAWILTIKPWKKTA